jgi:tRNA(fMet)-specific endonuclease VapC
MRYLLDTNAISHLVKYPAGSTAKHIAKLKADELGTSIIVSAELKFGYVKRSSKRLEQLIEGTLASLDVAPWEHPADRIYADLRTHLETNGQPISQNDMLIAAHALALNAVLITGNEREFSRVPGLKVENWLRS